MKKKQTKKKQVKKEVENINKLEEDENRFEERHNNNILEKVFSSNEPTIDNKDKIIKEWLNKDNIETKTELNQQQIYAITTLETLAKDYAIKKLKDFINNFKKNMLSKNRGTAKELVDILKGENYSSDGNVKKLSEFLK